MFNLLKTPETLVKEIHNEVNLAERNLLFMADTVLNKTNINGSKSERLKRIGFVNAKSAIKNEISDTEASLIRYYKQEYPFLKFLTEKELYRICKKYSLVYKPIENYIGDVPEKNISEIESAQKIKDCDRAKNKIWCNLTKDNSFFIVSGSGGSWCGLWGSEWYKIPSKIEGQHFNHKFDADRYLQNELGFETRYLIERVKNCTQKRQGLFICAPKHQFKGKDKSISSFIVRNTDPIVFRYVNGGVQIITKWGIESEDKDLINEKMN